MTLENNFLLELLTSKLRAISDQLMLKCLPLCTLLGPTRTSVRDRPKFSLENSTFFHLFYWHQKQASHDKITHTSSFSLSLTSNTANFKRVISFTVPSGNTTVVRKYGSIFCWRHSKETHDNILTKYDQKFKYNAQCLCLWSLRTQLKYALWINLMSSIKILFWLPRQVEKTWLLFCIFQSVGMHKVALY